MICDEACDLLWINTKFVKFQCGIVIWMEFSWSIVRYKIGIILRCHEMKTLFRCMMTGMFLWLCCMKVEEYILGCWMDECVWLKCVPCSVWWPLKMAQMGWKVDFDGLMGCEKFELLSMDYEFLSMVVWQSLYDYFGGICLQINHVWNFWKCKKCIFNFFCFSTDFNFDYRF